MCRLCETTGQSAGCRFTWDADAAAAVGGARIEVPKACPTA
jgi:hypothetical protein